MLPLFTLCVFLWYVERVKDLETRSNLVELDDPIYKYFPVIMDTSYPVTIMLWISFSWFIWNIMDINYRVACWSWIFLCFGRAIGIWLHPFKGHHDMVPLYDPIIDRFLDVGKPLRNDLFISGHCSTLTLLGLLLPNYSLMYYTFCVFTSILMMISRVHYSADCLMAPIFATFAYSVGTTIQHIDPNIIWCLLFLYPYHWPIVKNLTTTLMKQIK